MNNKHCCKTIANAVPSKFVTINGKEHIAIALSEKNISTAAQFGHASPTHLLTLKHTNSYLYDRNDG